MSHGPKGRADETPMSRGLKKGRDNEAGMPRAPKRVAATQNPYDDNLVVDMLEGWLLFFLRPEIPNFFPFSGTELGMYTALKKI